MDKFDFENVNTEIDTTENGVNGGWIALAIGAAAGLFTSIVLGVKNSILKKELKEEREKNVAYQKLLRIHESEIAELKNDKERRAYRDRLWAQVQAEMEE